MFQYVNHDGKWKPGKSEHSAQQSVSLDKQRSKINSGECTWGISCFSTSTLYWSEFAGWREEVSDIESRQISLHSRADGNEARQTEKDTQTQSWLHLFRTRCYTGHSHWPKYELLKWMRSLSPRETLLLIGRFSKYLMKNKSNIYKMSSFLFTFYF